MILYLFKKFKFITKTNNFFLVIIIINLGKVNYVEIHIHITYYII